MVKISGAPLLLPPGQRAGLFELGDQRRQLRREAALSDE